MTAPRESWTDPRLDDLSKKVDEGFARTDERMDAGFARVDKKFVEFDKKMDAGFAKMDSGIRELRAGINRLMWGLLTFGGGIIAALIKSHGL